MEKKQIYMSLCAEIPQMIIHTDWFLEFHNWIDTNFVTVSIRSDWDIDIEIYEKKSDYEDWNGNIWGWVIDMSDYEKFEAANSDNFSNEEFAKFIKDKVDFAFELCFSY